MSLMTDMLRQSIANSGVSVRVGDSRNLEPSKDEGTRSDDDNAWKYISVGDFSGLNDYTDREYDYRKIPFLGQFVGHAADAATDGIASLAQFAGFEKAGDFLHNEAQKGEAQLPSYTKPSLSLDYITDPNGLTSAAGMVTGSMLSIAPVAALIPESAVAGAVTAASKVPKIGGPLSRFVGNAIRWAPTGPVEAAMEGGAVEREMLENGASREDANRAAWDVFKGNAALLTATNAVEGGLLGKLVHKAPTFSNPIANTFSKIFNYVPQTAAEMAVQGYEEGAQEGISRAAMGQGEDSFSQILNPVDWTDEQWDAAKMGAAGSFPLVGGTAMMHHLQGALSSADDTEDVPAANNAPTLTSGNAEIDDAIVSAAAKHGLPADLLFAVAQAESDFDQSSVSSTGAKGIMQLMPDTAAALGVDADDMVQNIEGGARYLKQQLDDFGGNVEMALAAYNAGPGAVEKYKGVPPYTETQNYVAKIMGILDGANMNPATEDEPTHSLLDDAEPFIGTRMVNGARGCVEAVTKIGAAGSDFLRAELEAGVVNVDRLVKDAGDRVIPFDPSKLEEGDVIVYGDDTDSQQHVVLYDGKGGYIGNSSDLKLVVHRNDYNAMGSLYPTKIIKSGGRYGGTVNIPSVSGSVRPIDYTGLVVDAKNLQANAAAMKALIDGDKLTPAQKAAIIDAAEIIRDTPTEASTASPAEDALDYNAWQRLIDHKDVKGIFAKDPERVTRMVMRGEETQRKAQTVAAIENQQKVAQAQAIQAQVQAAAQAQPVANPAESAARLASVQQELSMPPMAQQEIAARLASYAQTTPHDVERVVIQNGLAHGDFSGIARALPEVYRAAAGRWMQQPQEQAQAQPQVQPQPQTQPPQPTAMPAQQDMQVPNVQANDGAAPSQEMMAQMPQQMQGQAQAVPTTEDLADIRQKLAALDAMMQGNPTYVEARRRGDWQTAAQEAAKAGHHDFARFYQMLHEKATGAPINITPYQNPAEKAAAEQGAVRPTPAPVPINHVDSMRPVDIPKSYGARRDFGRGLIEAMRTRNLTDVRALNDDLRDGEKRAIEHALKRIAQADAEDALLRGETAAQRANDNETIQAESRKKQDDDVQVESAQKQGKEKTANEGGLELADGYTTESGRPFSEADEKEFIIKPNGSRNFGEITKTISDAVMQQSGEKLEIGEIRLRVGNHSEGLIHAKAHEKQAQDAGYDSIENLIADVAENYDQIYMRAPVEAGQNPTYSLVKLGNKSKGVMNRVAPIYFELQADGGGNYYIVVSAMPKGDKTLAKQTKKDRLIYSSPGLDAATESNAGAVSASARNVGADSRGGSPTSDKSSGPVTSTIPSDVSESKQKRASNANGEGNSSTTATATAPMRTRRDGEDALSSVSNIPSEQEKSKEKSVQAKSAPLTKQEQEALTGTSEEAKEAYRIVRDKLAKSKNKSVVRAAKVGATLFARHADIYAKAYSKATGKPYTALDYLQDKFGLDADGKEADGRTNGFEQRKTPLSDAERKKMQLHIIQDTNPMNDDIHTGVRSTKDILSAKEAFETKVDENSFAYPDFTEADGRTALRRGYVEIYSSHPIVPGAFVTPSQMQAKDYAGSGRVYSKRVPLQDVAWLHSDEGQYAPVEQESFDQSAWHGTPHDFDAFDLGSIGTGEGAQVHGWGLYFAQDRAVSEEYKARLGGSGDGYSFMGDRYEKTNDGWSVVDYYGNSLGFLDYSDPFAQALNAIDSYGDVDAAIKSFQEDLESWKDDPSHPDAEQLREAIKILKEDGDDIKPLTPGSLFEVEIPENDVLLDEQKPFDKQPKFVQEKLEEFFSGVNRWGLLERLARKDPRYEDVLSDYDQYLNLKAPSDIEIPGREEEAKKLKQRVDEELASLLGSESLERAFLRTFETGKEIYEKIGASFSPDSKVGDRAASLALNEYGIKGITYNGRQDGRCFVVFDDKAIDVINKFNQRMNSIRKGSITPQASGRRIISLFEQADESTFLHEMGHMFLMDLEDLAAIDAASAEDLETVRDWATWQEGQAKEYEDTPWQKEFAEREKAILAAKKRGDVVEVRKLRREWEQERFARGFERYLETGKAPTSVLKRIFLKFKKFLERIYQAFKGTGGKASPEVEAVMGRMIAEEQGDEAEESKRNPVPTLDTLFQEAPALKDAALEYGATEKDGEVTFENPGREREFRRIADALQGDVAKKLSAGKSVNDETVSIERGERAVRQVLNSKRNVPNAMYRKEIGGIDFLYGKAGDPAKKFAGGYGIAHILAKHGQEAVDMIPTVIARGKMSQKYMDRVYFSLDDYMATVRLDFDGQKRTWLVTNFKKYANKKDSPATEDFARSAANPDGASSTAGGNLSLASTISSKEAEDKGSLKNELQEEKFSARHQEALSKVLEEVELVAPEKLSKRQQGIADFGKSMGMPVVFFKGAKNLHGFHASNGVTFLNTESETSLPWTFWHEALHWMKANNEGLFKDIIRDVEQAGTFTKAQLDGYRKEIGAFDLSDADVIEEMLADALPDVKRRVPFLKDLGKRNKSLAERFVGWIREVMDRFRDFFHTPARGLTTAQSTAMRNAFAALARDMVDERGRRIFRVNEFSRRITLANGTPLPSAKYSLDNREGRGDNEVKERKLTNRITIRKDGGINITLKYPPKPHESQKVRIMRRKAEVRDIDAGLVAKGDRSAYVNLLSNRSRSVIDGRIARGESREDIAKEYLLKYNEILANYSKGIPEEKVIGALVNLKGAMYYATDAGNLKGRDGRDDGATTRGQVADGQRVDEAAGREGKGTEDGNRISDKHPETGAFSMTKFSRDNGKPGSIGRFRKLLVGLKIGEAAESNLEVHRSNKEKQLVISASKLNQFMADKSLTEKNVLKTEDLGGGKIRVTYMPQDFRNVHFLNAVNSVRQLRRKNPFIKAIYDLGSRAMRLQEHLRNEGAKTVKEFHNLTKDKNDRKLVSSILLEGDAAGKEYGVQELRAMGANANVIKAYQLVRRTMREWYKRVNDARMQVETRTKTLSKNDLADYKKNHWIADADVLSVQDKGGGKVLLTWRGGKTYETKDKVMTKTELDALLQDKDINVEHFHKLNDSYGVDNYSVDYVERIKPLGNLTGYMPHFFHEWMVYEKHKDPKTGEVRLTTIGSGRSMNDAVRFGNEIARKNSDKEYVVRPKGFDLKVENSVVIGDVDFQQMAAKLAENTEMTLSDANAFLRDNAGATIRARHRFFGNAMHRTGAKGFDTDITYVLTHYLNTSARYIAMEQFKPRAISLYERWFGAFDADPKDATVSYVKGLIKDINGDPRQGEKYASQLIMATPFGKMISDAYGDRAALAVNAEVSTWNAISKLGLGNFASAAVNLSQFINMGAAMNDYGYAAAGLQSALNPTAADIKILEESGVLDEINEAADNGGYTQRRFGRVGNIYGAIKRVGELSLLPFQYCDTLMRKAAILGAYKQGVEKLGLSHEEAMERARELNADANFIYSSANAPLMIRWGSVWTQQLSQFQKYPIMQMEFMYNILFHGTRGQKVRFFLPYVLLCGIPGMIPFGEIFNQIFSFLFWAATGDDKDIGDEIKAEALRWAGKDPVKKAIVNASIYGVLAPAFGIDVSKRIGISGAFSGEFFGAQKPESVGGMLAMQLGGPAVSSAVNMANQIHNGNPIEALKAFSPALGNMAQAMVGVSRTTRHRVKSRYETAYDRIIHALGFRSVDESNNSFITSYEFDRKDAETHAKQEAIMDYLDDPSEANRQRINALGIKDKAIEEARIQQERSATERAKGGRPKVESGKTSKRRTSHKKKEEKPKKETLFDTIDENDEGM